MNLKYLSVADLSEIVGLSEKQLGNWCDVGYVVPVEGGGGPGNHRRFSVMQAVGVAAAVQVYRSEHGCVLGYVAKVVAAFTAADEMSLKKQFAAGKTHLARVYGGEIKLQGKQYDWPDVEAIYRDVLAKVAEIAARPVIASAGGRKRGLATSAE